MTTKQFTRRAGHVTGALFDVVLLVLINVSPGWQAVPVLTSAAREVVVVVDIALAIALVVNLFGIVFPEHRMVRAGDALSTAAGLTGLVHLLHVFPFSFTNSAVDWTAVTRGTLVTVVAVVALAFIVQLVALARSGKAPPSPGRGSRPR